MSITQFFRYFSIIGFLILSFQLSYAQSSSTVSVGVYECPPFVIKQDDNSYTGLSIELWQYIATQMGLEYSLKDLSLEEMLEGISKGRLNVGVSCTSITPEREKLLDFSHSIYETHSAIAIKKQRYIAVLINVFTNKTSRLFLLYVFGAACIIGGIYYFLERNVNKKLYSMSSPAKKRIEAFILGLLFITKGPFAYFHFKTLTGRVLTVFLALVTTLFIASITAILASSSTLGMLRSNIQGLNDLSGKKVGAIRGSTSSEFLTNHSIYHHMYDAIEEMVEALDTGRMAAIVADAAILKYLINKGKKEERYTHLSVLPYQFEKQNYGFALEDNSPYEERINQALLRVRGSVEWEKALDKYFSGE